MGAIFVIKIYHRTQITALLENFSPLPWWSQFIYIVRESILSSQQWKKSGGKLFLVNHLYAPSLNCSQTTLVSTQMQHLRPARMIKNFGNVFFLSRECCCKANRIRAIADCRKTKLFATHTTIRTHAPQPEQAVFLWSTASFNDIIAGWWNILGVWRSEPPTSYTGQK